MDEGLLDVGLPSEGTFLGRVRAAPAAHPLVVVARDGVLFDVTARSAATVSDVCELPDPVDYLHTAPARRLGPLVEIAANSFEANRDPRRPYLLSPVDLQAVKASGVTFVRSLLERVIEEQARGAPERARELRNEIVGLIGGDLSRLVPGSSEALELRRALLARGTWSQYLEVGIGPDAEVFTKCQPMASVGFGSDVGLHPVSRWNNPEPEIALVVSSSGRLVGATLGNDLNLRDVEGRSALLLGKAKDNNASAALGPFVRLFDAAFDMRDVRAAELTLNVTGDDGFRLQASGSMRGISRAPEDLVAAAIGPHHQYPDGMVLYLGTMFAPVEDRGQPGQGFTHNENDLTRISSPRLGALVNRVRLSTECAPWTYGVRALMTDLSGAGLLTETARTGSGASPSGEGP